MDTDDINVPDEILAAVNADKRKRPRGYPVQLDDDDLLDVRQHLRWLLETTWDQVGSLLPTVRTMAQLQHALKGWEKRVEQEEYVIKALLRSSERPTMAVGQRYWGCSKQRHVHRWSRNEWLEHWLLGYPVFFSDGRWYRLRD